jgi:hypothetical protein
MAYEQRVNRYGTWIDNSDDYFDLAPLSNMNVEMTDQTCQRDGDGGNNDKEDEEEE